MDFLDGLDEDAAPEIPLKRKDYRNFFERFGRFSANTVDLGSATKYQ